MNLQQYSIEASPDFMEYTFYIGFTYHYPDALVYAEGSTRSRTRRYQMGMNKYWKNIDSIFEVHGLVEGEGFIPFERNRNYIAFVAKKKFSNFK